MRAYHYIAHHHNYKPWPWTVKVVHLRAGLVSVRVYRRKCLHVALYVPLPYIITSLSVCMLLYLSIIICLVTHVHMLRCNNGGGGGNFSKVKRLFAKCIEIQQRLFRGNSSSQWDVWNADTFHPGIFHPYNYVCIYAHDHKLLEYARIFGFEPILGRWRSILWPFCVLETWIKLAILFIVHLNCIFQGASFELIKHLALFIPEKLQGFYGTLL